MATETRVETDGITAQATTTYALNRPMSRREARAFIAAFRRTVRNASFEAKTREIERDLETIKRRAKRPRYGSRPWYAAAILEAIGTVRQLRDLRSPGGIDAALAAAMRVGYLAAEWTAKGWPDLQLGRAYRADQRQRSLKGVETKRSDRAPKDKALRDAVAAYRTKHPGAKVNRIATDLVRQHGRAYEGPADRTKAIDALRHRIKELDEKS